MDASHPTVCYSAAFLRGRKARNALRLQISINAKVFGFCCWVKNGTDRSLCILYECLVLGFFLRPENFISNRPNHALASFTDYPAGLLCLGLALM